MAVIVMEFENIQGESTVGGFEEKVGAIALREALEVIAPQARTQAAAVRGAAGNMEVERLWLNAAQVRWTYTPYDQGRKGGAIEKGWNIQAGLEG